MRISGFSDGVFVKYMRNNIVLLYCNMYMYIAAAGSDRGKKKRFVDVISFNIIYCTGVVFTMYNGHDSPKK